MELISVDQVKYSSRRIRVRHAVDGDPAQRSTGYCARCSADAPAGSTRCPGCGKSVFQLRAAAIAPLRYHPVD